MRILFISYLSYDNLVYKGGNWVNSLARVLSESKRYEVAIAYISSNSLRKEWKAEGVRYFPIYYKESIFKRLLLRIRRRSSDISNDFVVHNIIAQFKPDIVQLFGIETSIGGIARNIKDVPVVVHIQGIISAILNNWFPRGFSSLDVWWNSSIIDKLLMRTPTDLYIRAFHFSRLEKRNFNSYHYYLGRTEWDCIVSRLLAPNSKYYHCDEVLRTDFYSYSWKYKSGQVVLSTILNGEIFKGFDTILRTAVILSSTGLDFVWNIYGIDTDFSLKSIFEKKIGHSFVSNNVRFKGKKDAKELAAILAESTFYVHPSHADNSPNSLCEAMLVGVPCIASYVGGVPSLCIDNISGFLVPDGDAFQIAHIVLSEYKDKAKLVAISLEAHKVASSRHNVDSILKQLDCIYKEICSSPINDH